MMAADLKDPYCCSFFSDINHDQLTTRPAMRRMRVLSGNTSVQVAARRQR
jgi:hypothetical protein